MKYWNWRSTSAEMTRAAGQALAAALQPGDVLALCGDLGSGKTCFIQGLARGLQVPDLGMVNSPTFVILNVYPGRCPVYHFDAYRLDGPDAWTALGVEDLVSGDGVCAVEWADRIAAALPADRLEILFAHHGPSERILEFRPQGPRSCALLETARPTIERLLPPSV